MSLRFGEENVALQQGPPPVRDSSTSTGVASGPAGTTRWTPFADTVILPGLVLLALSVARRTPAGVPSGSL